MTDLPGFSPALVSPADLSSTCCFAVHLCSTCCCSTLAALQDWLVCGGVDLSLLGEKSHLAMLAHVEGSAGPHYACSPYEPSDVPQGHWSAVSVDPLLQSLVPRSAWHRHASWTIGQLPLHLPAAAAAAEIDNWQCSEEGHLQRVAAHADCCERCREVIPPNFAGVLLPFPLQLQACSGCIECV